MKNFRKVLLPVLLILILLALSACGGSDDGKGYKWKGAAFTVKGIAEQTDENAEPDPSQKIVGVTIDFGKNELSSNDFNSCLVGGKMTLAGVMPVSYTRNAQAGDILNVISREVIILFKMSPDYEINESDLVITE